MTLAMLMPADGLWLLLMIPGLLLGLYAQMRLRSAYARYSDEPSERGITGADAARTILDRAGLEHVPVLEVRGQLTDHYDPSKRAVFLSSDNYHGASLAAVGVAAHETGHALQHQAEYAPMHARTALVPVTNLASNAATWVTVIGFGFGMMKALLPVAIVVFGIVTLFHLVTLPVEFDASRRAKEHLLRLGLVTPREQKGVSRVLGAAAMTYVAAMVASLAQLMYFVLRAREDRR